MTKDNLPQVKQPKNALEAMAERLAVKPDSLQKTLKATVCKGIKGKDGKYREITNEEFISFVVVCNTYKLNPLLKEIYAFPDMKSDGIVPIVSTDGFNKLMTTHEKYKSHYYVEAKEKVTMPKAKPCPEWMEIHIQKIDGTEVIVREYLDECFRDLPYANPWQSHTKRMLRHKCKIQGAREAFGFGGIYDEDEASRIVEAQAIESEPDTTDIVSFKHENNKQIVKPERESKTPKEPIFDPTPLFTEPKSEQPEDSQQPTLDFTIPKKSKPLKNESA